MSGGGGRDARGRGLTRPAASSGLGSLGNSALSGQQAAPIDPALLAGQEQTVIPNLASYVVINSGLTLFTQQPQLKRIVPIAIDRAIREIISPVVERSVTISCVTTRELMLKDFAMEPDEQRMRKSAQLMVQNLAGSLALVTCKEPLRVACGNHLRSLLQQAGADAQLLEQVVQVCAADNLDLGCTLIEKAATEKAVRDVEEALAPAFAIRRKHREQTGLPYYDMSIFTNGRYPASLPEALRPKPGGLLPAQLTLLTPSAYCSRADGVHGFSGLACGSRDLRRAQPPHSLADVEGRSRGPRWRGTAPRSG